MTSLSRRVALIACLVAVLGGCLVEAAPAPPKKPLVPAAKPSPRPPPRSRPPPPSPKPPPSPPPKGVVVTVIYMQEGATGTTVTANQSTLISFVHKISGGAGLPSTPLSDLQFQGRGGLAKPREAFPKVVDASCEGNWQWVQGSVLINSADAYSVQQNIAASLRGPAKGTAQKRWADTMGKLKPPPCFAINYTHFGFTEASMPPPSPPSPRPPPRSPRRSPPARPTPSPKQTASPPPPKAKSPRPPPLSTPPPPLPASSPPPSETVPPPPPSSPSRRPPPTPTPASTPPPPAKPASPPPAPQEPPSPPAEPAPPPVGRSPPPPMPDAPAPGPSSDSPPPETSSPPPPLPPSPPTPEAPAPEPSYGPSPNPSYPSPPAETPSPAPGPGSSPVPGDSPGYSPGSSPGSSPGYSPGSSPGYSPGSSPGYSPGYIPGSSPSFSPDPNYGPSPTPDPGSVPSSAPAPSPAGPTMCMAEPQCKIFVANSICCQGEGINVPSYEVTTWMVCTADVYLPEAKCLTVVDSLTNTSYAMGDPAAPDPLNTVTIMVLDAPNARSEEMQVVLPLAYFVPPISATSGRLAVTLDLEAKRTTELDGMCSLRLRTPCEWDGVMYDAVGAVEPVPLLSVLSANETAEAEAQVQAVMDQQLQQAEDGAAAFGDGTYTDSTGKTVDAGPLAGDGVRRRLLALAGRLASAVSGRKLKQDLLTQTGTTADPLATSGDAANVIYDQSLDPQALSAPAVDAMSLTTIGGELPVPNVDPISLPPLTDVLAMNCTADICSQDFFISWLPANTTELCSMQSTGELVPENFLLGGFEELVGFEEECNADSLPDIRFL